ncbi:hypothetical protein HPB50_027922 [Hyalomma asiaticum]|nr:hypothetical protein HPB50_027922 [Hyalomma asiaticum]
MFPSAWARALASSRVFRTSCGVRVRSVQRGHVSEQIFSSRRKRKTGCAATCTVTPLSREIPPTNESKVWRSADERGIVAGVHGCAYLLRAAEPLGTSVDAGAISTQLFRSYEGHG